MLPVDFCLLGHGDVEWGGVTISCF